MNRSRIAAACVFRFGLATYASSAHTTLGRTAMGSRYYHADDQVFQKLRAAGKTSWDEQADPTMSFDKFILRPFLEASLAEIDRPLSTLSALEVGCGSGPASCFLASQGLTVRGIDVSPTALEMARAHAAERGLSVRFDEVDICTLADQSDRYDLVIDGHCLHCLVFDEDRAAALAAIRQLLKPEGVFLIEAMIAHPDLVVKGKYRIAADGILSVTVDDPANHERAFEAEGVWFAPHRRLLTQEQLAAELEGAGFTIHDQQARAQQDIRKPMLLNIRAGLK